MNNKLAGTIVAAVAFALPAVVQAQNPPQAAVAVAKAPGAVAAAEGVQLQGKIKSIDKARRAIVVVGPNGNEIQMNLSSEVRNFEQIKVGDLVTLTMLYAVAAELRKVDNSGVRERHDSTSVKTAKAGDKPAAVVETTVRVIANVVAINPMAQTVTLRGPKRTLELAVRDPAMLQNVRVGDQVEAVYTEAAAIAVSSGGGK